MFQHHDEYRSKKIIDEFILSSSNNESIKYILRNIDCEASNCSFSVFNYICWLCIGRCNRTLSN